MGDAQADRREAILLGAMDAAILIATVPYLPRLLSERQVRQFQRILDAAVLNPKYREAYKQAKQDSVISRAGNLVLIDEKKARKADKLRAKIIRIAKREQFIRLDYRRMLAADALTPRTNNPDEALYLTKVQQVLDSKGVWLYLGQPWNPKGRNPYEWEFTFTLGLKGDPLKTKDAIIDREELLGTAMLGRGYAKSVLTGHVQTQLKHAFDQFDSAWSSGFDHHIELMRARHMSPWTVVRISDAVGRASFPDAEIWDRPNALRMKAWEANEGGDVIQAQVLLLIAIQIVESNAVVLAEYLNRTIDGARFAVKFLTVFKVAGTVADTILSVVGGVYGIKIVRAAGAKLLGREARHKATQRLVLRTQTKGIEADLASMRIVPQPKGTILGNRRAGHSAGHGRGSHTWP